MYQSSKNNARLIKGLQDLLGKHYDVKRGKKPTDEPIFLENESCPTGMMPCDESMEACPDEDHRMEPSIYNSEGIRCYTSAGVSRARDKSMSSRDRGVVVDGLRALVVEVAKLRDMNSEIDRAVTNAYRNQDSTKWLEAMAGAYGSALEDYPVENIPEAVRHMDATNIGYKKSPEMSSRRVDDTDSHFQDGVKGFFVSPQK